jgi:cation transport ATPase
MSTLKSDNTGKGQVQQKVETFIGVDIFDEDGEGEGVCDESGLFFAQPEKCKTTGKVDGTAQVGETPESLQKGKADVSCDLGDGFGQLSGEGEVSPGLAQQDAIIAAFDGRKDVKVSSKGKVKIKVKGVPDAAKAIAAIRNAGWHVGIASGDAQVVVDEVARCVGVDSAAASGNASPEEKLAMVERAARRGPVVMVGDGVNDAAAIAAASVGIGVHGGAQASLAAADVYLTRPGLTQLVDLVEGARRTMGLIRLGIGISLAYNVVGVGLAMFGLINPLVAAVMMPASSLTVLLVAWRGKTFSAEGRFS